jgi:hypothetical protein
LGRASHLDAPGSIGSNEPAVTGTGRWNERKAVAGAVLDGTKTIWQIIGKKLRHC